jgi:outer membrane immunogenic protein
MKKLAIAALALTSLAGSAFAADMAAKPVYKAPPPAPAFSWTGCYVGAGGGYGMFDLETQEITTATGVASGAQIDQAGRGWFGTVQGGCDYQFASPFPLFSSLVIGVFADGDWGDIHGNFTNGGGNVGLNSGEMKLKSSWAVGGRLGFTPTPSLLTYLSGGYTEAKFNDVTTTNFATGAFASTTPGAWYHGWFIGSGVEYSIGWLPGLTWKNEYRFADYSAQSIAELNAAGVPNGSSSNIHPFVHTVRSELVYRFNLWR